MAASPTTREKIQLTDRINRIEVSATMAITAEALKMKAQGIDLADFGAGEPHFATPQHIKDAAIEAIQKNFTKYTAVPVVPEVRKAIVDRHAADFGSNYTVEECVFTTGGKLALFNAIQVLVDHGDEVILPVPYWVSFKDIVRYAGGECVLLQSDEAQGFRVVGRVGGLVNEGELGGVGEPFPPVPVEHDPPHLSVALGEDLGDGERLGVESMGERDRAYDLKPPDSVRRPGARPVPLRQQEECHREPEHRGDPEYAPDIERRRTVIASMPREHKSQRACDKEELDSSRPLIDQLLKRPIQIRKKLGRVHGNHAKNGVTAQRVDIRRPSFESAGWLLHGACHRWSHILTWLPGVRNGNIEVPSFTGAFVDLSWPRPCTRASPPARPVW